MAATYNLSTTAYDIIRKALLRVRAISAKETPKADQIEDAKESLNFIIKFWQSHNIHRWKVREGVLFLENEKNKYDLGSTGDRTTKEDDFSYSYLDGDHSSGTSTIYLTSVPSGIKAGDNIGIKTSTTTRHWTTITSTGSPQLGSPLIGSPVLSGSPLGLTIDDVLPADASDGYTVFFYRNKIQRPLTIRHARRAQKAGGSEVKMFKLTRSEFYDQTTRKTSKGIPNQYDYEPTIPDDGELRVWPTPNNVDNLIFFSYVEPFKIIVDQDERVDIPDDWIEPLTWVLASNVMSEYGLDEQERAIVDDRAQRAESAILRYDYDRGVVSLTNKSYRGRRTR